DFGLAKLTRPEEEQASGEAPTMQVATDAGLVMGTVGYMSPEQVRGKAADPRSDLFSFGTILYEMLSGKRAFRGDTPADTMRAILKEDPPELSETARNIPPGLARIVEHCLEKNPAERFQSAHDIAFNLQSQSGQIPSAARIPTISEPWHKKWSQPVGVGLAIIAAFLTGYFARARSATTPPKFRQLTFQRGSIQSAAFAPDGQTVIYSAMWNGKPTPEVFSTRIGDLLSRPLQLDDSEIVDISPSGEMAIL